MPGLCGIVDPDSQRASELLGKMLDALSHYEWHVGSRVDLAGAALGHVSVTAAGAEPTTGLASAREISIAFDGEIYGGRQESPGQTNAEWLAHVLVERGPSGLGDFHGCFACAVWDPASRRLSLATDRFGMRPLYWTTTGGRFLFASEIKALLTESEVSRAASESGLAEFIAFGHYLGDATSFESIRVVPAGSWLTYDSMTGEVSAQSYYEHPPLADPPGSDDEWLDAIGDAFDDSVAQCCAGGGSLGLSLSGGLDARTILGVVPAGTPLTCVTLGLPGSIDVRAASELAAIAGQSFHPQYLTGDFLGRFEALLDETIRLTDGQYLDQGIVLTTLPAYRDAGIQTLLRGHAGELMHMEKAYSFSLDDRVMRVTSRAELVDWLWDHLTAYMLQGVDEGMIPGRLRDIARAQLERRVAAWDHVEPVPQRIWHLFVAERLRRETALSLQMLRNFVEVRLPYLEPRLISLLLAAPAHLKRDDTIQRAILRARRPEFLQVVNANTGTGMGSGPLRTMLASLRLRVLSKLRVPGYQPYERLGLWLARDLQPLLRRVLLAEGFLSLGLMDAAAVERLIRSHAARTGNHTFLLMALLILDRARASRGSDGASPGKGQP